MAKITEQTGRITGTELAENASTHAGPSSQSYLVNLTRHNWFLDLRTCPECGGDHIRIKKAHLRNGFGWKYNCYGCPATWMSPHLLDHHCPDFLKED